MKSQPFRKDIYYVITDRMNHLVQFTFLRRGRTIEEMKGFIRQAELKTLEEYTGKSTKELEKALPGVSATFNDLVCRLKKPNLTLKKLDKILEKVKDRSWYSKPKK